MNEYIKQIYILLASQDPSFKNKYSVEEFEEEISEDEDFAIDIYDYIVSVDAEFEEETSQDDFVNSVVKKKEEDVVSTFPEEDMASTAQVEEEVPGSLDSSGVTQDMIDSRNQVEMQELSKQKDPEGLEGKRVGPGQRNIPARRGSYATQGEEDTFIESALGKNVITDFFGDMIRAAEQGFNQGQSVDEALEVFGKGRSASDEDIQDFLNAYNSMQYAGVSDEMRNFEKVSEEAGGGVWGFIKGLVYNPSVAPQLFVSSTASMLNPASLGAAGATVATGAGVGAAGGGVGAIPGAIASIPFAMGAAGLTLEAGLSFGEFLQEEVEKKGLQFNLEGVREVLNDDDAMFRARSRAAGRGLAIGTIDALSAGMGGKVVRGMTVAGKSTGSRLAASTGIEALGGSTGEAVARGLVGQEMDITEIGFEGIAGASTAPITYGYGKFLARPKYKINGEERTAAEVAEYINNSPDKDFAGMSLEIENDPAMKSLAAERKKKLRTKNDVIKQLKSLKSTMDKLPAEERDKFINLEVEKRELQGQDTVAAKERIAEIEAEQKEILSKEYDTEDVAVEEQVEEGEEEVTVTMEEVIDSFTEEELANLTPEQIDERERELIKQKKDAIQESSTEEVDVQEPAQDSEEVGEGDTAGETTVEGEEEVQAQDEETAEEEVTDEEVSEEEIGDLETLLGIEPEPVTKEVTEQEQPTEEVMEEAGEEVVEEAPVPEAEVVEEEVVEEAPAPEAEVVEEEAPVAEVVEVAEEPITETTEVAEKESIADRLKKLSNTLIAQIIREQKVAEQYLGKLMSRTEEKVDGGVAIQEVYEFGVVQKIMADDGSKVQRLVDFEGNVYGIPLINLTMDARESGFLFDGKESFSLSESEITKFFNSKFGKKQKATETKKSRKKKTLAEELAEIMNYTVEEAQEEIMKDDFIGYLDDVISSSDMFQEFRYRIKPLERIKKKYLAEQAKKETAPAQEEGNLITDEDISMLGEIQPFSKTFLKDILNQTKERIILKVEEGLSILESMYGNSDRVKKGKKWLNGYKKRFDKKKKGRTRKAIVGPKADLPKTVLENYSLAVAMEKAGASPKNILNLTGWRKAKDGKWRYEMSDISPANVLKMAIEVGVSPEIRAKIINVIKNKKNTDEIYDESFIKNEYHKLVSLIASKFIDSKIKDQRNNQDVVTLTLGQLSPLYDNLIKAYPQLKDFKVEFNFKKQKPINNLASYDNANKTLEIFYENIKIDNSLPEMSMYVQHEVQHAIQEIEGFEKGASPKNFTPKYYDNYRKFVDLLVEEVENDPSLLGDTEQETVDNVFNKLLKRPNEIKNAQELSDRILDNQKLSKLRLGVSKYNRVLGESEARTAQNRLGLTQEMIDMFPFEYDVPERLQILMDRTRPDIPTTETGIQFDPEAKAKKKAEAEAKKKKAEAEAKKKKAEAEAKKKTQTEAEKKEQAEVKKKSEAIQAIEKLAEKAKQALSKVLPDVKIIVHQTEADFNKATKLDSDIDNGMGGTRGYYMEDSNTIHINGPHATKGTIAHEVVHAILLQNLTDPEIISLTDRMVKSLDKMITDPELKQRLKEFTDQYKDNKNEEYVAELVGILSENYDKFNTPEKGLIKRFIERIFKALNIPNYFMPAKSDVGTFIDALSQNLKTGKVITEADIKVVTEAKESVKEKEKPKAEVKEGKETGQLTIDEMDQPPADGYDVLDDGTIVPLGYEGTIDGYTQEEMDQAMEEREKELDRLNNLPTPKDIAIYNMGKFHPDDFDRYGDPNVRKNEGMRINRQLSKNEKKDIDTRVEEANKNYPGLDLTIQDVIDFIIDRAANPDKYTKAKIEEAESYYHGYGGSTGRTRKQAAPIQINVRDSSVFEIVNEARKSNFSRGAIKYILTKRKGLTSKEADALLNLEADYLFELPASFGDIGLRDGIKLFNRIAQYMVDLYKTDKTLFEKGMADAVVIKKVMEFLEQQPEFIAQGDPKLKRRTTLQDEMFSDLQKALGIRPTQDLYARIKQLRKDLRERLRGARELQKIKKMVRNFIRINLPKTQYGKKEILDLMKKVTEATDKNIDAIVFEVQEIILKKQFSLLSQAIDGILNGKYRVKVNKKLVGKKVDNETAKLFDRIKSDYLAKPSDTAKRIEELNGELNEKMTELEQQVFLSDDEADAALMEMQAIAAAIAINNAKLAENSASGVESLNQAMNLLEGILGVGRQQYREMMKESAKKYRSQFEKMYYAITGEKIDASDPDAKEKAKQALNSKSRRNARKKAEKGIKKWIRLLKAGVRDYLVKSESLEGLMDIIQSVPGVLSEGTRKIVYEAMNASSRIYKERMMMNKEVIINALKDIYGKNWKDKVRTNSIPEITGVYKDPAKVQKAQEIYDKNPTKENETNLKIVKEEQEITLSANEIGYLFMQFQDPANEKSFMNPDNKIFGNIKEGDGNHTRIMQALVESLGGEFDSEGNYTGGSDVIDFAQWQMNDYFPNNYAHYNEAYLDINRTDLPWNEYYGGRIYRVGVDPEPLNLLGNKNYIKSQVAPGSTLLRVETTKPIQPTDMISALMTYTTDMEWYAAYGPNLRDIDKIFNNPMIKNAITEIHGKEVYKGIRDSLEKIASRGILMQDQSKWVNRINNFFIYTKLAFNPSIMVKQLTSFITYANDIGMGNYLEYSVSNIGEMKKIAEEIYKNSVYVRDRLGTDIREIVESYGDTLMVDYLPKSTKNFFLDAMMFFVKTGDIGAIFLGGMPNYSYYKAEFKKKNPNATEQEAIDYAILKFEDDTKNTQQSSDLQDKDFFQTANALMRSFNMFLSSPKQYLRKEFGGLRKISRGLKYKRSDFIESYMKDNPNATKDQAKKYADKKMEEVSKDIRGGIFQFVQFHVVMPLVFQYVALGLPGLLRPKDDEDDADLMRAALIGNFNALFIIGDIVSSLADAFQGKPWAGTPETLSPLKVTSEIADLVLKYNNYKDPEKKAEISRKIMYKVTEIATRFPASNVARYGNNLRKIGSDDDPLKDVLRVFNYSEYTINRGTGGESKKTKSKRKVKSKDGRSFTFRRPSRSRKGVMKRTR